MVASRTLIQHKQYQLPVTIGYLRKSDSSEQEHGADATMCLVSGSHTRRLTTELLSVSLDFAVPLWLGENNSCLQG